MSEVTCPFCCATLFDSELKAGECNTCMARLPPRLGETVAPRLSAMGRDEDGRAWESVRSGVGLLSVAALLSAGPLLACVAGIFIGERERYRGEDPWRSAIFLFVPAGLTALAAHLLGVVGLIRSLLCPERGGLQGLVLGTAACLILGILLLVCPYMLTTMLGGGVLIDDLLGVLAGLTACGGVLANVAAVLLFFLYLRGVARSFGDAGLGGLLLAYGLASTAIVVGSLGVILFETTRGYWRHDEAIYMVCGLFLEGTALMIWGGILLRKLRGVIPTSTVSRRP
jgi:hypothetical protein